MHAGIFQISGIASTWTRRDKRCVSRAAMGRPFPRRGGPQRSGCRFHRGPGGHQRLHLACACPLGLVSALHSRVWANCEVRRVRCSRLNQQRGLSGGNQSTDGAFGTLISLHWTGALGDV